MSWAVVYFGKVLNHLGRYSRFVVIITSFLFWVTGTITALVTAAIRQGAEIMAQFTLDGFGNVNIAGLEFIGYANAALPLSEMAALLTTYCTMWILIITFRWVKSFVPTMGN